MFLKPADLITFLHKLRVTDIDNPSKFGFFKNSRNVWEKSYIRKAFINGKEQMVSFHYADQNPNTNSAEAKLVASGKVPSHGIGWFWMTVDNKRQWLAKLTPKEVEDISRCKKVEYNTETKTWFIEK